MNIGRYKSKNGRYYQWMKGYDGYRRAWMDNEDSNHIIQCPIGEDFLEEDVKPAFEALEALIVEHNKKTIIPLGGGKDNFIRLIIMNDGTPKLEQTSAMDNDTMEPHWITSGNQEKAARIVLAAYNAGKKGE